MRYTSPDGLTPVNPVIQLVMLISALKPDKDGFFIFTVPPIDGLPTGVALNDIARRENGTWSCWQKYTQAVTALVANDALGLVQVTWRKFNGTWMSTADEFIPDGIEYQTGKLWNGKAVFRKCWRGTSPAAGVTSNTGYTVPTTGTVLVTLGNIVRADSKTVMIASGDVQILAEMSTGKIYMWVASGSTLYASKSYIGWVEYTKE